MLASAAALEFRVEFCIKSEHKTKTESEWFHTLPAQIHTWQHMDHTSEGIVECQGQNPCCIIAGLTKQVGGTQVSDRKVMKMLIKCCLIFVSILQGIEMNTVTGVLAT